MGGLVSSVVLVVAGGIFFASTAPTTGQNPLWQLSGLGFVGIFIAIPGLAISLVGGAPSVWRRGKLTSRVLAVGMLVVSVPFFLYSLVLLLAAFGLIHLF